jgi:hypothetical protein
MALCAPPPPPSSSPAPRRSDDGRRWTRHVGAFSLEAADPPGARRGTELTGRGGRCTVDGVDRSDASSVEGEQVADSSK